MSRLKYWGSYGLLLLTLLLSLFYAIAFNSDLGWYVFVFITLFIFLTLVSTVNFNQDISLKVRDDTYTNVGEQNKIHLLIESPKRVFFPILKIENDTLGISENLFWFYGQRKELVIHWVAKERMKQEFVVFEVSKQDIFGVIKKKENRINLIINSYKCHKESVYIPFNSISTAHNLSQYEKRMLWINRQFLSGHFPWMVQLVKSTNLNKRSLKQKI